mmetsp:Transcript_80791/g.127637  ORF Transcript_80791/g.127637 Transcript_80791/m.127637 type:complete len:264 (+) Transcript_80791:70-861(+)
MPNTSYLPLGILLVAATATRITLDKSEHPGLQLPSSAKVSARVTTDGAVKWSSTGTVSYKSTAWYLTAVSDHILKFQEAPNSGADHRRTTFVGWNSLLSGMVSRYLFVTDYDEEGTQIGSWCLMSKEPRNKGYIDPFVEVQEKFMLDSAFKGVWSWKTPTIVTSHNTRMHGTMNTEVDGKNTINATIVSTRDDHQSVFTVEYSDHVKQAMPTHNSIIYRYMDESCDEVPNFEDVPQICVDELLAVEYGCGYSELQSRSGTSAA